MRTHERIELHDSGEVVLEKISEGNPGALDCLVTCLKEGERVDPEHMLKGWAPIITADSIGIYGSELYLLWNDVCGRNPVRFIGLMRAWSFGYVTAERIRLAATESRSVEESDPLWVDHLLSKVRFRLPNFTCDAE